MTPEKLVNLKVTTDGWVDTSSLESIVAGATRGARTDEDKALALFHWCRRMVYHHRFGGADRFRRNLLMVVNSFGFNLCGSQAAVFSMLLGAAGMRTRVICGEAGGDFGGHTFLEAFYDDRWHCFDPMTSFFVYTRHEPPQIASVAELAADPTLVTRAVEEHRAPPGFLCCMGRQEHAAADKPELSRSMGDPDLTWSTLLFKDGSLLDFWARAVKQTRVLDETGVWGGRYTPGVMDFTLRAGEELVRLWDNQGKWLKALSHADFGPHHVCGAADEGDPVNFKWFEPYLRKSFGHAKKCYRWFGNGWLDCRPESADGVDALTIPVKCPYAGVEVELDLFLKQSGAKSETRVSLVEGGKAAEVWRKSGDAEGLQKIVIIRTNAPLFEYELRVESSRAPGGSVAFAPRRVRTTFMENIFALPGLLPGKNVVTVSAAAPVKLKASRLVVGLEWSEGAGWKRKKSVSKEFADLPATFEIKTAGPKLPRMKRLAVRLEAEER